MRIILFRGLFGSTFSTGMDELAEKLARKGHDTSVHRWTERSLVQKRLISKMNRKKTDLAIIGHSLGANAATILTQGLYKSGHTVGYLATLDAPNPREIPAEIFADNFQSSFVLAKKMPYSTNYHLPDLSHTELDNADIVHKIILSKIVSLLAKKPKSITNSISRMGRTICT